MKHESFSQYNYISYSIVFLFYIVNIFLENDHLNYVIGIMSIGLIIISFLKASRLFQVLGGLFLILGFLFYMLSDETILCLPPVMTSNISLLILLSMLSWMNSVVRSGGFDRIISSLMEINVSNLGKLYVRSSFTILILAAFLNLSSATITQDVLKHNLLTARKSLRDRFVSTSTLRGYSLALLWSPLEILLATSILVTDTAYASVLGWLILIAVLVFVIDAFFGYLRFKKHSYEPLTPGNPDHTKRKEAVNKVIHLVCALVLFLVLVIIIGNLFNLDFILTVSLIIFPFAFGWSVLIKRRRRFLTVGWISWKSNTNTMQNFIVLFISLSLFSAGISHSDVLEVIHKPMMGISKYPLLVFVMIQFIFIFMSMFGIHPIATIGILTNLLNTLLRLYNPVSIAIVMITSSIATLTVGTYGLLVTLTAVNMQMNPYKITLGNFLYSLLLGGIGSIVGYLIL